MGIEWGDPPTPGPFELLHPLEIFGGVNPWFKTHTKRVFSQAQDASAFLPLPDASRLVTPFQLSQSSSVAMSRRARSTTCREKGVDF